MTANQLAAPLVGPAVLALLRADATLAGLLSVSPVDGGSAVYESLAPQGAAWEYVVIDPPAEMPANTLGRGWGASVVVALRAVSRRAATAQAIMSRIVALLDVPTTPLVVTGYPSVLCEFSEGGPGYREEVKGEIVHHYPALIRVTVHS